MPVHTFSTKTSKPDDTALVERIKEQCDNQGKYFSGLIIQLLRDYDNGQGTREVQDSKSSS